MKTTKKCNNIKPFKYYSWTQKYCTECPKKVLRLASQDYLEWSIARQYIFDQPKVAIKTKNWKNSVFLDYMYLRVTSRTVPHRSFFFHLRASHYTTIWALTCLIFLSMVATQKSSMSMRATSISRWNVHNQTALFWIGTAWMELKMQLGLVFWTHWNLLITLCQILVHVYMYFGQEFGFF